LKECKRILPGLTPNDWLQLQTKLLWLNHGARDLQCVLFTEVFNLGADHVQRLWTGFGTEFQDNPPVVALDESARVLLRCYPNQFPSFLSSFVSRLAITTGLAGENVSCFVKRVLEAYVEEKIGGHENSVYHAISTLGNRATAEQLPGLLASLHQLVFAYYWIGNGLAYNIE